MYENVKYIYGRKINDDRDYIMSLYYNIVTTYEYILNKMAFE